MHLLHLLNLTQGHEGWCQPLHVKDNKTTTVSEIAYLNIYHLINRYGLYTAY